jgi:hypothetical protein
VLHHDGKLRPFISLAICGYWLPRIFETVAVKAMMRGNPVERFDPREFRKVVNEPRRKQNLRSVAGRAVGADKLEPFGGCADGRYQRSTHRDGPVAAEFFPRFIQK